MEVKKAEKGIEETLKRVNEKLGTTNMPFMPIMVITHPPPSPLRGIRCERDRDRLGSSQLVGPARG